MRVYSFRLEQTGILVFAVVIVLSVLYTCNQRDKAVEAMLPVAKKCVVIDPGHGGWDPGKTGVKGENEKDINLKISILVQQYLEQGGANVIVTRNDDSALGGKKREDMKERKKISNESTGDILISIHQNSFQGGRAKGAQVFYYNNSTESQSLAQCIQNRMKSEVDTSNQREPKANKDYYILKNTNIPAALVECGFISNRDEEALLNDPEYQQKIAWAIYVGVVDYFESLSKAV